MEIPDDTYHLNLENAPPVPRLMAQVATILEERGSIYITRAGCIGENAGTCAYLMGQAAEDAAYKRGARSERPLDDRGRKAIQESQTAVQGSTPTGDEGPRRNAD